MIAFIAKEFHHIFRDRRTMLILIGIPIVQMILFGFAISNEVKNVNVAVMAPHYNGDIERLMQKIDANEYFNFVGRCDTQDEMEEALMSERADMVLCFDKDFKLINKYGTIPAVSMIINACDPNLATSEGAMIKGIIQSYYSENAISSQPSINVSNRMLYNPRMESSYNFVPGIMGMILMVFCAMMTSVSIVKEKEMGTMEVLLISPTKPLLIIFAKMVPYFMISCVNLATILLLSVTLLHIPIAGNMGLLLGVSLLYIALSLAIGLLISTVMKTQVSAMLVSVMALLMPTVLLSGLIYPIENLPWVLQWLSSVMPARWYIDAIRKVMIQGVAVTGVIREIAILAGMLLAVSTISLKKYKKRLE